MFVPNFCTYGIKVVCTNCWQVFNVDQWFSNNAKWIPNLVFRNDNIILPLKSIWNGNTKTFTKLSSFCIKSTCATSLDPLTSYVLSPSIGTRLISVNQLLYCDIKFKSFYVYDVGSYEIKTFTCLNILTCLICYMSWSVFTTKLDGML